MDQSFTVKNLRKPRVLIAPLDWGLGHATRCFPVIQAFLNQGADVWLAGEGDQEQLLKEAFPDLPFLQLAGYRIQYSKTKKGLIWKLLQQFPKLYKAIKNEHSWLQKMITEHAFDLVISDNRYGLYHNTVPCVFITHQLIIKSSAGKWTEQWLQKKNYKYINRFSECWVPDLKHNNNVAGDLSHPQQMPSIPVKYIGLLSRFKKNNTAISKEHLLIILSGPEPQRTIFEEKIIAQIGHYNGTATIVRGLPAAATILPSTSMLHFYNHLPAAALNDEMMKAAWVISRSGYSTVMDLQTLQKKSILVPTPGQTEQEYLGAYLTSKHIAVTMEQKSFSLPDAIKQAQLFSYQLPEINDNNNLQAVISNQLRQLNKASFG